MTSRFRVGAAMVWVLAGGVAGGVRPATAQPLPPCEYFRLLVSGYNSDNAHVFDGCDGSYQQQLDGGGALNGVQAIVRGVDGHLYVASEENDTVVRFDWHTGALIDVFVGDDPATPEIDESGGLEAPTGIAFGPGGNLYVASFTNDNVLEYSGSTGAFLREFVAPQAGGLDGPDAGMVFGPDGNLYVPSFNSDQVLVYDGASGALFGEAASSGLANPRVVLFTEEGNILVTSWGNGRVYEYDPQTGDLLRLVAMTQRPTGMTIGPDGLLYVTSDNTDRVVRFDLATGTNQGEFIASGGGGLDGGTFLFFWGELPAPIPAASEWGMLVTGLAILIAGTLLVGGRRTAVEIAGSSASPT